MLPVNRKTYENISTQILLSDFFIEQGRTIKEMLSFLFLKHEKKEKEKKFKDTCFEKMDVAVPAPRVPFLNGRRQACTRAGLSQHILRCQAEQQLQLAPCAGRQMLI